MILVSVRPGEEVLTTLTAELARQGVTYGAVVSLIGAVDTCSISTMAADDQRRTSSPTTPSRSSYPAPARSRKASSTCTSYSVGRAKQTRSGHRTQRPVDHFFVNAYVLPL